ncbi:MAG: hypothetical protein JOZ75_09535 [Candidatus Dormibacteraeota bacterium]|nr:hypothetical protein [Candidatus Dormibacteraeota bacterium]
MSGPAVCCPSCWSWSELGKSATCARCGTPLIHADGRVVAQAAAPAPPQIGYAPGPPVMAAGMPPAPPPGPPGWPPGAASAPVLSGPAWAAAPAGAQGRDWVTICRWAYGVYAAVVVIGLVIFGLLVHHLTVPIASPNGGTTNAEVDLGPAFAVVAIIAALLFALVIWLLRYTVVRAILLGLQALGLLGTLGNATAVSGGAALTTGVIVGAAFSVGFIVLLTLSLIYRRGS